MSVIHGPRSLSLTNLLFFLRRSAACSFSVEVFRCYVTFSFRFSFSVHQPRMYSSVIFINCASLSVYVCSCARNSLCEDFDFYSHFNSKVPRGECIPTHTILIGKQEFIYSCIETGAELIAVCSTAIERTVVPAWL